MSRKRMLGIMATAGALLLPLAGCAGDSDGSTGIAKDADGLTEVHLGILPIAGYAPVFLAQDEGFFEDEGLKMVFDKITDPANGMANLTSGSLQFSLTTPGSLAVAVTQNVPLKEVAPLYFSNGEQGVFVPNDSPIKSIEDLAGADLALGSLASSSNAGINILLDEVGVDPKSVNYSLVPIGTTATTLLAGRVDAAQIAEPALTAYRDQVRPIIPDMFLPFGEHSVVAVMVTSTKFDEENPEAVAAFQRAMATAQEFAAANEDAVREAIANNTETPPDTVGEMVLPMFQAKFDIESQKRQAQGMVDQGFAEEAPDMESVIIRNDAFED